MAMPMIAVPELSEEDEAVRPLLLSIMNNLRSLYVYCEAHGRADIGGEVVDALSMCQQDFSVLVDRLSARGADARAAERTLGSSASPLAARTVGSDDESDGCPTFRTACDWR